ncbi:hypothetical protein D3C73_1573110 [compost metagenome]
MDRDPAVLQDLLEKPPDTGAREEPQSEKPRMHRFESKTARQRLLDDSAGSFVKGFGAGGTAGSEVVQPGS